MSIPEQRQRGSFIVAAVFFMLMFLAVAGFGIDLSRYFLKRQQTQSVADGAALAGAQALQQATDDPDVGKARDAIIDYVRSHQGDTFADLYELQSESYGQGYIIEAMNPVGPTCGEDLTPTATSGCQSYPEGTYWVAVLAFNDFRSMLLPQEIFGNRSEGIVERSIAQISPRPTYGEVPYDLDCGIYAGLDIEITGNNLDASGANLCSNGNIDGGSSNNGVVGNLNALESRTITPPGGGHGEINHFEESQSTPSFDRTDPNNYDVDLKNDYDSWDSCSGGGPSGGGKVLTDQSGNELEATDDGGEICVTETATGYELDLHQKGQIQQAGGNPVSIYVDGNVTITGNNGGINGGLYAEGDITTTDNNMTFNGTPSTKGGLALWSEGDLDIGRNGVEIDGIVGSDGDLSLGHTGGGTGPDVEGMITSGANMSLPSNSNNFEIDHDPSRYDPSVMSNTQWSDQTFGQDTEQFLYSNAEVFLVQ